MSTILDCVSERKKQFEQWLEENMPADKKEFLTLLKNKSTEEFIFFFKAFVCGKDINEVVDVIFTQCGIKREELESHKLEKFIKWISVFAEFISQL